MMKRWIQGVAIATGLAVSLSAAAFWNPKDWDPKDGWGNGSSHPMAPFGWGSNDKRGPFGGEHGWGAVDSMMDGMWMGDAMSDLNTDVEWDLNLDTKLKGKASGEGRASGENRAKNRARSRADLENRNAPYYPAPYYYPQQQPVAPVPYGYGAAPYAPVPYGAMGGMPFAPAMPQMAPLPPPYWRR